MASCSVAGSSSAAGSKRSMTLSTRRARSLDQTGKATSGCIFRIRAASRRISHTGFAGCERLEHATLQDLDLLLGFLQRGLAILQQLGPALVRRERFGQR